VNDDSKHDPHAREDTQNTHEDERWDQLHRDYNDSNDNENNAEINTPEMSDDEDDLASILDLPPAKPKRGDIMDDNYEAASNMTKIDMTGDIIVLHEEVTTVNVQGVHMGVNEADIFDKKEMLAHDTNLYDGKHVTIQVARCDDTHMDEDTKYVNTFNRHDAYKAACKMDVDKTQTETNIENIGIMRADTSMPPGTATLSVKELHTREDHFAREEPSADNKTMDKYECEEELPADNEMLNEYEYSHNRIVMTSHTETLDVAKMIAYMDENYNNTSQMGDKDEPIADLERNNPHSVDETYEEEDVANNKKTNGVANKKESRGSP
jgi:hypothetical protein